MPKNVNREKQILDKGYNAVRTMAKDMVANGANLADILFHANQLWHEFKVGAYTGGLIPDPFETGSYLDEYSHKATMKIITADPRYAYGVDSARVAQLAENPKLLESQALLVKARRQPIQN